MTLSALRYFGVVSINPGYVRIGFAVLVVVGCWQLYLSPDDPISPLATLLFWQMFAVSTGFRMAARRGYYDPLWVSGPPRWRVAMAHWCVSVRPGAVAWASLTMYAGIAAGPVGWVPLETANLLAWFLVSTCAWAAGLWLPRMGSGVVWVTSILALATTPTGLVHLRMVVTEPQGDRLGEVVSTALTFVGCPFLLLGSPAASENVWVRGLAVLVAVAALVVGVYSVMRSEFPLTVSS